MPLVKVDAGNNSFHRLINRRVFENNVGCFPAQLERKLLFSASDSLGEQLADRCRPGKRDFVDVGMIDNRFAGFAGAGHNIHNTIR